MVEPHWVTDTSVFTHFWRAGHGDLLRELTPGDVLVVPTAVELEILAGQHKYSGIPSAASLSWTQLVTLSDAEELTQLLLKAEMGGGPRQHLGECAAIAVAKHRTLVALIDDRAAIKQADILQVQTRDTLWLVVEAYVRPFGKDRQSTAALIDSLLETGMKLPVDSGSAFFPWAYRNGYLPRE